MIRQTDFQEVSPQGKSCELGGRKWEGEEAGERDGLSNPFLAFEKNYPKNIFITLI
jgi:hypothetical protein